MDLAGLLVGELEVLLDVQGAMADVRASAEAEAAALLGMHWPPTRASAAIVRTAVPRCRIVEVFLAITPGSMPRRGLLAPQLGTISLDWGAGPRPAPLGRIQRQFSEVGPHIQSGSSFGKA